MIQFSLCISFTQSNPRIEDELAEPKCHNRKTHAYLPASPELHRRKEAQLLREVDRGEDFQDLTNHHHNTCRHDQIEDDVFDCRQDSTFLRLGLRVAEETGLFGLA